MAAEHLLERGFTNLASIGKPGGTADYSVKRQEAFEETVRLRDLCPLRFPYPSSGRRKIEVTEAISGWLHGLPKPVGIMGTTDQLATWVVNACFVMDIRVPEDVAVIGVDNEHVYCETAFPPLSSVDLDHESRGARVVALLDELMQGKKPPRAAVLVPPKEITVRQSTDVTAVSDPVLIATLTYIRDHAKEGIGVKDVVSRVPACRRRVEILFRKHLNRTIADEIRRVQLARAQVLLTTSDMPIEQVAFESGFREAARLYEAFRKSHSITPAQYRRGARFFR
jgi:LacI family transcriptional regulator